MMDVKPLHNEQDYYWAIREVALISKLIPCWGPLMETVSRFCLIKDYEDKYFATSHGDPVDVLRFAIESMGRSQADLAALIGRNRASEILNHVRPLTLEMIRAISMESKIPAETLTAQYELSRAET